MTKEEAIEVYHGLINPKIKEAFEFFVPELRESEDERIRKWLSDVLDTFNWRNDWPYTKQQVINYLEKQKEQKSFPKFKVGDTIHCKYDDREFTIKNVDLTNMVYKYTKEGCGNDIDYADEDFELVEQKPAECINIEELAKHIKAEFESFRNLLKKKGIDYQPTDVYWTDYARLFVSSAKKLQKPAEWSDTDNIGWDEAFACVTRAEKSAKNEEELQNAVTAEKWLKEIKFKDYVHPVKQEWSEQDIQYYNAVMDMITNARYLPCRPRDEIVEWLKSLKNRGNFPKSNTNSSINDGQQPESRIMTREMIEGRLLQNDTESWNEDYNEEDVQTRFAFYTYKDDPSVLYLSNVFVKASSRKHGFGTRILKAAEKVAEAIGAITIRLKVKQGSSENTWYRKQGYGYVAFEDGYDWLEKRLEYMKPNKPSWSEEDEKFFKTALWHISYSVSNGKTTDDHCDTTDWLKGVKERLKPLRLQPHWKPSEEQMKQLKAAASLDEFGPFVTTRKQFPDLESLYEQLKKLI